ncbi:MAG: hypothetical protein AB7U75_10045 [Hyphomicrobiaceae bacterium]
MQTMSEDQSETDLAERAFDIKIRIGHLFRPKFGSEKFPSQADMRANLLALRQSTLHSGGENPLAGMRNVRRLAARWRKDFRKKRPPWPHMPADRIAFAHDPDLANELCELIDEIEAIRRLERERGESGRQGMSLLLLAAAPLLERIPGPMASLVKGLDWLRMVLEALDEGDQHPILSPAKRSRNRPRNNARRHELRLRCVLALHVLLANEKHQTPARRLRLCELVYKRALSVAQDVRGEEQGKHGFSARMIHNWYDDRTVARPRVDCLEPDLPYEVHVNTWTFARLHEELAEAADRAGRKSIQDRYLAALDPENFDRPLHAVGPRHWPPFDGS